MTRDERRHPLPDSYQEWISQDCAICGATGPDPQCPHFRRAHPYSIEDGPERIVVTFAKFASDPRTEAQDSEIRNLLGSKPVVIVLLNTLHLSTDWWRFLGQMGMRATRLGQPFYVACTNEEFLKIAERVGARSVITFVASLDAVSSLPKGGDDGKSSR